MKPKHQPSLAETIRKTMTQDGRTVYRLSLDSGVSQGVLGRFLRGNRDVTLETADKICKALGLSLQPVKKGGE